MKCIRNSKHRKTSDICQDCLKEICLGPRQPDIRDLEPDLRALFSQLTLQNRNLSDCWPTSYTRLRVFGKSIKIQNLYYAFYKADIGNEKLRKICCSENCTNPAHYKSNYEPKFTLRDQIGNAALN